jgi:hypothetical protein
MPSPTLHTPANPVIEVDLNGNPIDSPLTTSGRNIQGNVASGALDAGNPVKVGGEYLSTAPVFTTGMRTDLQTSANGSVFVDLGRGSNNRSPTADALAAATGLNTYSQNAYFNGTAWDRQRGDLTGAWSHAPANTASTALSGTIATAGATATVAFINTVRQEVINPSAAPLWASWGATPTVNGAGSFQIAPGATFATDRTAGTLTLLSTVATQTYTVNRYS